MTTAISNSLGEGVADEVITYLGPQSVGMSQDGIYYTGSNLCARSANETNLINNVINNLLWLASFQ